MNDNRPIWLLDVDGVINALPHRGRRVDGFQETVPAWDDLTTCRAAPRTDDGHGGYPKKYLITYSPTLMRRIRELHESGAVEVRWLTTWGSGVFNGLTDALGLPNDWEVVGECPSVHGYQMLDQEGRRVWWKAPLAVKVWQEANGRPIIWTDDDLVNVRPSLEWARQQGICAIAPEDTTGISPAELAAIELFIERAKTEAA